MIEKIKSIFFPCQENKYKPKFLETKFLVGYLIFLLLLKIIVIPFFIYFPQSAFFAQISKSALIFLTDEKRKENGQGACHTFSNEELFQIILDLLKKLSDKVGIAKTLSERFPN